MKGRPSRCDELADDMGELGLEIELLDLEDGIEMARILAAAAAKAASQPKIGGLGLGDAACLAVAARLDRPAVFSGGMWEVLDLPVKILPFR
ncbi:MAG: hypothetical protein ACR2MO_15600 [Acidimicrobiales bacterium]